MRRQVSSYGAAQVTGFSTSTGGLRILDFKWQLSKKGRLRQEAPILAKFFRKGQRPNDFQEMTASVADKAALCRLGMQEAKRSSARDLQAKSHYLANSEQSNDFLFVCLSAR